MRGNNDTVKLMSLEDNIRKDKSTKSKFNSKFENISKLLMYYVHFGDKERNPKITESLQALQKPLLGKL